MNKKQKLELTWIGKDEQPVLEPRILIEDPAKSYGEVIKWLRPARNQFHIYYDRNTKRYEPDFVAETASAIYMVETKKAGDLDTDAVQKKKTAALNYCAAASAFTAASGGKPWIYLLIPHDAVMLNMTLEGLAVKYGT